MTTTRKIRASFVVGPEKTATTLIQLLIERHPDARLPQGIKETFFFDKFFGNGIDWYLKRFDLSGHDPHLIEVAPSYFSEEEAMTRIAETFPGAEIVVCVRDVVERTISHYHHQRRYGYLKTSLTDSLDPAERPLKASLYSYYLPLWEKAFGKTHVHVLDMALLKTDPREFAKQAFEAVGLAPIAVPDEVLAIRTNKGAVPRHYLVAHTATLASNLLKKWGLYGVLAFLRKTPVYTLAFGGRKRVTAETIDAQTREMLEKRLAPERRFLAKHYGIGNVAATGAKAKSAGSAPDTPA